MSDTVCSVCSSCPSGYYKTGGCSGTSDPGNEYLSIGCSLCHGCTVESCSKILVLSCHNKQNQLLFVKYHFCIHADLSTSGDIDYSTYYDDNSSLAAYISTNSTAIYTKQILRYEKGNTMGTGFYWNSGPTYNVAGHAYSINVYIATWSNPVCANCSTCSAGNVGVSSLYVHEPYGVCERRFQCDNFSINHPYL